MLKERRLEYTRTAVENLDDIFQTVLSVSSSEKIATNIVKSIGNDIRKLQYNVTLGRPLSAVLNLESELTYYRLVSGKYIVIYEFDAEVITVDLIVWGKMDYIATLFNVSWKRSSRMTSVFLSTNY